MYWLYSLGVMLIMLTLVDIVYFLQKKYTEYDKLSNKEKESFDGLTEVLSNNKKRRNRRRR